MTSGLLAVVLGLALVDSINPSAIGVTLYLLLTASSPTNKVLIYLVGVFSAYFVIGTLLMLGLGALLATVGAYLEHPVAYAIQGGAGALMLLYGIFAPSKPQEQRQLPPSLSNRALLLLGITITVVEFATALPYIGAIGILTTAGMAVMQWLPILFVYNLIFILPPLMLLIAYKLLGTRLQPSFERYRAKLQHGARNTWLTIVAIIGFGLVADSLRYFNFFGLIPIPNTP